MIPENIFIIVPSFNEEQVIQSTVSPLIERGYTVVVVDDCSTDNSRDILRGLPVHYLRHELNLGQGAALQTGFEYALQQDAEYVVTFDADGQHNFEEIPDLLEPIFNSRADITMGSRFKGRTDANQIPTIRKFVIKGAILIDRLFTGLQLTDSHNGFRAMNKKALSVIKLRENKMAHASEIIWLIKQNKIRYEEVPVKVTYSDYSKTKGQSSLNSINILIDLILKKIF